ncbi:MAG: Gfo/Idh/MocA family oxidoreductase [Proteobacteria bacterium]|nr:Gfo/Idh/MocA family oxidoreductase [Pseudomonadota bacterium]
MPKQWKIAVLGAGRAGRARIAAIEAHPRCRLAGVVRRRPGPGEPDLEAALADPGVDAVIVCTPNLLHARAVRAALEAGKHVAVEYPLAESSAEAAELFERAAAGARVLHVEHIELLSGSQRRLRESARGLGRPRGGGLRFSGGSDGWIAREDLAGGPGLRALARLHRLVDLFGPAEVSRRRLETSESGYRLEVGLRFAAGGETSLSEVRAPQLARASEWEVECEAGILRTPPASPERGLFARDLEVFVSRLETRATSYVSDARVLEVLSLVDAIDRPAYPPARA